METIRKQSKKLVNRLEQQFIYMLAIGALFSIIGWAVPEMYYKYLDTTEYYSIQQPVSLNKSIYYPCEDVILSTTRTSLRDLVVDTSNSLVKVDENNPETIVRIYEAPSRANLVIEESTGQPIAFIIKLPCDLSEGTYFWQGAVEYTVHGVERVYLYSSDLFQVGSLDDQTQEIIRETNSPTIIREPAETTQNTTNQSVTIEQTEQKETEKEQTPQEENNDDSGVIKNTTGLIKQALDSIL